MKVKVTREYFDKELGQTMQVGQEYEVKEERGKVLLRAKVAKEVKKRGGNANEVKKEENSSDENDASPEETDSSKGNK